MAGEAKVRRARGAMRRVAGRGEILAAARELGVRDGWKAVTIRGVAELLGYTAPLLYEHFRDKQEILTEIAIEGQLALAGELGRELPTVPEAAVLTMVERYWNFMLANQNIYRLMSGMDGVSIDRAKVTAVALESFGGVADVIALWLEEREAGLKAAGVLLDEMWAVLHGMASLYLDRSASFDLRRAQSCVIKLLEGTLVELATGQGQYRLP